MTEEERDFVRKSNEALEQMSRDFRWKTEEDYRMRYQVETVRRYAIAALPYALSKYGIQDAGMNSGWSEACKASFEIAQEMIRTEMKLTEGHW